MIFSAEINGQIYGVDLNNPLDISIPLRFNGKQPNAYSVQEATSEPCVAGELVGDTRRGGSCNFEQYTFIPHCNGTHTECVGHISNKRISIRDCLKDTLVSATLISVQPEKPKETKDTYVAGLNDEDRMITKKSIEIALSNINAQSEDKTRGTGLIVRTLPNDQSKLTRKYGRYVPPFFSKEAMEYIVKIDVRHLLVDLPSVDRIFDDGKLSGHRSFWNVNDGEFAANPESRINSTITELIYVSNEIKDGNYLLNLQIAAFESDTSPSRPVLFEFIR